MGILRDNKDSLMSVLEAMVHDPLVEWGIDDRGKSTKMINRPDPRMIQARKSLDPVMQKLNGKLKKANVDGGGGAGGGTGSTSSTGNSSLHHIAWTSAYSTNSLVDALIRDATSNTLLSQMCECADIIAEGGASRNDADRPVSLCVPATL
jgi:serine/threonine-protein kinase ATR